MSSNSTIVRAYVSDCGLRRLLLKDHDDHLESVSYYLTVMKNTKSSYSEIEFVYSLPKI